MSRDVPPALGRIPPLLLVPALLGTAVVVLPMVGLLARSPWRDLSSLLGEPDVRRALLLSVTTSTLTAVVCLLLGLPLAWLLARGRFRGCRLLRAVLTVPLVLPPVVGGVALLGGFGRNGLLGGPLRDAFGVSLPFTTAAVVVAHTFVALPFFVLAVEGTLHTQGERYDAVAATLGARRWTTFRRVTLPLALPGIAAGTVLAWARSLGEFGATITFAGNFPGATQT
ncbi:molybdate ABC transporter permease subunit, partial [Nocardioides massiliensis]